MRTLCGLESECCWPQMTHSGYFLDNYKMSKIIRSMPNFVHSFNSGCMLQPRMISDFNWGGMVLPRMIPWSSSRKILSYLSFTYQHSITLIIIQRLAKANDTLN